MITQISIVRIVNHHNEIYLLLQNVTQANFFIHPSIHPSIDPSNVHVPETTTIFFSDQNVESENVESSVAADKREIEARTFLYRGEDLVGARGVYAWFMARSSRALAQGWPGRVAFDRLRVWIRPIEVSLGRGLLRAADDWSTGGAYLSKLAVVVVAPEGRNSFGGGKAPPPEPRKVNPSTRFLPRNRGKNCSKRRTPSLSIDFVLVLVYPPPSVWGIRVAFG